LNVGNYLFQNWCAKHGSLPKQNNPEQSKVK
jgi:hypothetical protein